MKKIYAFIVVLLLYNNIVLANIVDELTKLNNLFKEGAISKDEFNKAKEIIFTSEPPEKIIEPKKNKENKKSDNKKKVKKFDEDLTNSFISLNEIDEIGVYKKISNFPKGMFKRTNMSSKALASKATQEMYETFVQNKNLMEKNPEDMMKAMGHFEIFYMQKLKDEEKTIKKFKKDYPNISKYTKKKNSKFIFFKSSKKINEGIYWFNIKR